jgi:hypothetical protein
MLRSLVVIWLFVVGLIEVCPPSPFFMMQHFLLVGSHRIMVQKPLHVLGNVLTELHLLLHVSLFILLQLIGWFGISPLLRKRLLLM